MKYIETQIYRNAVFAGLVAVAAWCCPASALAAPAGTVVAVSGEARVQRANGSEQALARNASVEAGDTLITGKDGKLMVRFVDNAMILMRPASRFRVDEYEARADPLRSVLSVLSGGLRMLTGEIARKQRDRFTLNTPTAVIGVRGTDFDLRECRGDCPAGVGDGLYLSVIEGAIVARTERGEFELLANQHGVVRDRQSVLERQPCAGKALTGEDCRTGGAPASPTEQPGRDLRTTEDQSRADIKQLQWCTPGGAAPCDPRTAGCLQLPVCR
jgi:hypothetical protein